MGEFLHAESEFAAGKCQIFHPEAKNRKSKFSSIPKLIFFHHFSVPRHSFFMILVWHCRKLFRRRFYTGGDPRFLDKKLKNIENTCLKKTNQVNRPTFGRRIVVKKQYVVRIEGVSYCKVLIIYPNKTGSKTGGIHGGETQPALWRKT